MSQNDFVIANQGFASFRSDLNNALKAMAENSSGTSAPSTTYANMLFYDTTNNILKIRNEDNDAFISLFTLDQTNDNIESLTIDGALTAVGLLSVKGGAVFNEDSADVDFRVESNSNANMFFVDGGNNAVGIGTNSPTELLEIHGDTSVIKLRDTSAYSAGTGPAIFFQGKDSGESTTHFATIEGLSLTSNNGVLAFQTRSGGTVAEKVRITDAGRVGINTTSPTSGLTVEGVGLAVGSGCTASGTVGSMAVGHASSATATGGSSFVFGREMTVSGNHSFGIALSDQNGLNLSANNTMAIVGGSVLIGKSSNTFATAGSAFHSSGEANFTLDSNPVIYIRRNGTDGDLVQIFHENTKEGSISSSGSTIFYNTFSGSHWSRLTDNSKPTILKGTIIETIDEMCDWYQAEFTVAKTEESEEYIEKVSITLPDGKSVGDTMSITHEGITYSNAKILKEVDNKHPKCKISDIEDSKRVYGVHADWDNDDDTINDMFVLAVGTHVVRINKDVTVQSGDLLSSNGDGTAKVQDDDIIRSKTVGKVLTNLKQETYSDGSYTVPCALYCG